MAKKINPDEELNNNPSQGTGEANEAEEQKKREEPQTEIPSHVNEVLKSFSAYETLYVDTQGGVFTSDTPETIRRKALLYKNPHYKSQTR